ncbi:MAG: hypothetical protein H6883_05380 [Rhodobiaceae bacterium]|nr:hypothetical protein [Rhodobiaceae bacterium]
MTSKTIGRKAVMSIAAAGLAALAFTAPAEAGTRGSVTLSGPGYSVQFGSSGSRHHGYYGYRYRDCRSVYKTKRVWTRYGWTWQRVKVGVQCDPRHHGRHQRHHWR